MEEAWMTTAGWQELFRDPKFARPSLDYFSQLRALIDPMSNQPLTWSERWKLIQFGLASKSAMLQTNLKYFADLADEAGRTVYTSRSAVSVPKNLLMDGIGTLFVTARLKHELGRAVQDLLRVEVALYRYRNDHGSFPKTTSALAPAYLKTVPTDPLAGAVGVPFRYQQTGNGTGFLLYSLGTDLKDDGGKPTRFPGERASGDIVAGRMRQPRKATP
jgi:hypothetical protein